MNDPISIIPKPVKINLEPGTFTLNPITPIYYDPLLENVAIYLKDLFITPTGFDIQIKRNDQVNFENSGILLCLNPKLEHLGKEGYFLSVTDDKIQISAPKPVGVFYGIQSLRQLFPIEIESKSIVELSPEWTIPCVMIEDHPRFSWRGFMLDEGRHFLGKEIVKRMLDLMALHKLNVFHWHLTEDQGWRIEIKKYPDLTNIGSKRNGSQIGGIKSFLTKKMDTKPHHGYYSQQELSEIVSYAEERFITIVPEVDMPGHSMSALASYPGLSCTGGPFEVQRTFGIKKEVYCPGKEEVFIFLQDVLDEVMTIFHSKIIHTGGDEVPKNRWKECSDCQKRMKDENILNENELQNYFTNRIAKYLSSHNRILMGWNDILADNLDRRAIGQHWLRGDKQVLDHLRNGRKFVMSNFFHTYLDYDYNLTPLRKTYNFEPIPKELEEKYHTNVLGIEGPLWTEWVPTIERFDWQVFPRITAIAEIGWSDKNKDYNSFKKRLFHFLHRLKFIGVQPAEEREIDPNNIKRLFSSSVLLRSIFSVYSFMKRQ